MRCRRCSFFRKPEILLAVAIGWTTLCFIVTVLSDPTNFLSVSSYSADAQRRTVSSYSDRHFGWYALEAYSYFSGMLGCSYVDLVPFLDNETKSRREQRALARKDAFSKSLRFQKIDGHQLVFSHGCTPEVEQQIKFIVEDTEWIPMSTNRTLAYGEEWGATRQTNFMRLLLDFTNIMETAGIDHFVMFGSLIGVARHGSLIPWDLHDIDTVIVDEDGSVMPKAIQLLHDLGYSLTCENNGVNWRLLRDDSLAFRNVWDDGLEPFLDIYRAVSVGDGSFYYAHMSPNKFFIPVGVIHPTRLVSFPELGVDGEIPVLRRAASDGVLDCTHEYANGEADNTGTAGSGGWRQICYNKYEREKKQKCKYLTGKLPFVEEVTIPLADLSAHIGRSQTGLSKTLGQLPPETRVNLRWQSIDGNVIHFWLDLSVGHCAVLLDEPHYMPAKWEQIKWPWELPEQQCTA